MCACVYVCVHGFVGVSVSVSMREENCVLCLCVFLCVRQKKGAGLCVYVGGKLCFMCVCVCVREINRVWVWKWGCSECVLV